MISYDDFKKVELKTAKVLAAERVLGSEKLIKIRVDLGEPDMPAGRQVVAGIGKVYEPEALIGKNIIIVANLEPRKLMGEESQGMLLAATDPDDMPVLLMPDREVPPGSSIR